MITQAQLQAWIDELGFTTDEISAVLRAAEIRGHRRSASLCPISKWLQTKIKAAAGGDQSERVFLGSVSVGTQRVALYLPDQEQPVRAEFPEAVADWIRQFDNGRLPEFEIQPLDAIQPEGI